MCGRDLYTIVDMLWYLGIWETDGSIVAGSLEIVMEIVVELNFM